MAIYNLRIRIIIVTLIKNEGFKLILAMTITHHKGLIIITIIATMDTIITIMATIITITIAIIIITIMAITTLITAIIVIKTLQTH